MNTWLHDLRSAIRSLLRTPALAGFVVVTLAIAIGANTAIFSVVDAFLIEPLPFAEPDRTVVLWQTSADEQRRPVSLPDFLDWKERARSFSDLAAYRGEGLVLGDAAGARYVGGIQATANTFTLLGLQPTLGRVFTAEEEVTQAPVAVVGDHLWRSLGRSGLREDDTIRLNGTVHRVIGILPIDFRLPSAGSSDVWVPMPNRGHLMDRGSHSNTLALGRLADGVSIDEARAEMAAMTSQLAKEHPGTNEGTGAGIATLKDDLTEDFRSAAAVLWAAVALVLLIACANVANLLIVRTEGRRKELAVRSALGASRGRLVRQLVGESLFLSVLGGALGLLVARGGLQLLRALENDRVSVESMEIDGSVLLFTLGVSLLTGLLSGLLPALRHGGVPLIGRENLLATRHGTSKVSRVIAGAQVAFALALTTAAALMIASFGELTSVRPGFEADGLLHAEIPLPAARYPAGDERTAAAWRDLLDRAAVLPSVEGVALSNPFPLTGSRSSSNISLDEIPEARPGSGLSSVSFQSVTPSYFQVMRIPVLKGRTFETGDPEDVMLVDRTFVETWWTGEDPVGRRVRVGGTWHRVIGMVDAVRTMGVSRAPEPMMYFPIAPQAPGGADLVVRTSGPVEALAPSLRALVRRFDPDIPAEEMEPVTQLVSRSTQSLGVPAAILSIFAAVALFLAAIGTWGVTAWSIAGRTREIGIRMALGAERGRIFRQLLRDGLGTAAIGAVAGLALSVPLARSMRSMLYGVGPADPRVALAVALILFVSVGLAVALPARRAMHIEPDVALREE